MYIQCDTVEQLDEVRKYINPTPDKLRSEFAYYGIEVDVEWT